jgi:hypothetical protein
MKINFNLVIENIMNILNNHAHSNSSTSPGRDVGTSLDAAIHYTFGCSLLRPPQEIKPGQLQGHLKFYSSQNNFMISLGILYQACGETQQTEHSLGYHKLPFQSKSLFLLFLSQYRRHPFYEKHTFIKHLTNNTHTIKQVGFSPS